MPWTLAYGNLKQSELIDQYLLILGKALCLANNFEDKCDYYFKIIKIIEGQEQGVSLQEVAKKYQNKSMLGKSTKTIFKASEMTKEQKEIVDHARESRNYIVHEGASLRTIHALTQEMIQEKLDLLEPHIVNVAKGDNLASTWVYSISEREPPPVGIQSDYLDMVFHWIYGD